MRKVASIVTIRTYDRVLINYFDELSFSDLNYDLEILKKHKMC